MSVLPVLDRPLQLKFGDATYDKRLEKPSSLASIILYINEGFQSGLKAVVGLLRGLNPKE